MAKSVASRPLDKLFRILAEDWRGDYGKYPDQAIFAVKDKNVASALSARFDKDLSLEKISALTYHGETGLNALVFEFSSSRSDPLSGASAFLVLLDGACKVVALRDPFDPTLPNMFAPPPQKAAEQPFVLARPSVTSDVVFSDKDMGQARRREKAFLDKLGVLGDEDYVVHTRSPYTTRTPSDYWTDYQNDDCGSPTILT